MKCEEVDAILIDYLENKLEENLRKEIEKHVEVCERCLDELKDSQEILQLISKNELEKPDDSMRIRFYNMLHSEIKKSEGNHSSLSTIPSVPWYIRSRFRTAAGLAILVCGTFFGYIFRSEMSGSENKAELAQLKSEITALKKTALFTMLNQESSSDRIQAVNYADEFNNPDEPVIEVLVKTLNHDKNVNVRMAAAYALSKFADRHSVCDSLVKSLSLQDDPILQVTLINILVERKEKSAVAPIQHIIENKNTLKEVRGVAENGIKLLI